MQVDKNFFELLSSFNFAGVSFVSIKGYSSDKSDNTEVSDILLNVGQSIENSKKADLKTLQDADLKPFVTDLLTLDVLELARAEKIQSIVAPDANRSNGQKEAYITISSGLKFCKNTESLLIQGFQVRKTVIRKGEFKAVKSSAKTLAKKHLDKVLDLKMAKFKYLKITNITASLRVNGDTFEIS